MASTPRQLIDQATRHAVYLERYKAHAVSEHRKLLKRMERLTLGLLAEDITTWNRARLEKQLAGLRGALRDASGDVTALMRKQVEALAEYELGFEARSLSQVVRYDFDLPSDRQLHAAVWSKPLQAKGPYQGALLDSFLTDWSDRAIQRLDGAIRLGFAQGIPTREMVTRITGMGGAMNLDERDLTAVVRTGLNHTATMARESVWEANKGIIKGVRWVSTLDDRTSQECQALDGQEFAVDDGPRPPAHVNCRSTTVPILDDRFRVLDEGGTRAARTPEGAIEKVPAKQTYYGWLKTQPREFVEGAIGPSRAKLLLDGGLSAQRFQELQLGKDFKPLPLYGKNGQQGMADLEPVAFARAGL